MKKERLALLFFVVSSLVGLAGCGNSEDGPQLSDQEKIDMANKGRQNYNDAASSGAPQTPVPSAP